MSLAILCGCQSSVQGAAYSIVPSFRLGRSNGADDKIDMIIVLSRSTEYDQNQEFVVGKAILQAIASRLSEEDNLGEVLELGCGTGYFTKEIAKKAKSVIATDLSDTMLKIARTEVNNFWIGSTR